MTGPLPTRGGRQRIPRPDGWRTGPAPWWQGRPLRPVPLSAVRLAFAATGPDAPVGPARKPEGHDRLPFPARRDAAVLCLVWEEPEAGSVVLLTRRSPHLRSHTGEVSFPGGRIDLGESAADAARREAWEEVGIDPGDVDLVGRLPALATFSSESAITPFVGVLDTPPALAPNPAEVARAFTAPLGDLLAEGTYHQELWSWPGAGERPMHFFDLPGDTVWGATARMLVDLLDALRPVLDDPIRPSAPGPVA